VHHHCSNYSSSMDLNPGYLVIKHKFSPSWENLRCLRQEIEERLKAIHISSRLLGSETETISCDRPRRGIPEFDKVLNANPKSPTGVRPSFGNRSPIPIPICPPRIRRYIWEVAIMFPTSLSQAPKPDSGEAGKAVLGWVPPCTPLRPLSKRGQRLPGSRSLLTSRAGWANRNCLSDWQEFRVLVGQA
jgi:hypothetical protein